MEGKKESIVVRELPVTQNGDSSGCSGTTAAAPNRKNGLKAVALKVWGALAKYAKFVGPGIMISVAYIDPG
jgi:metal iron transporter